MRFISMLAVALAVSCSASNPAVKPEEMSAAQHRAEADREAETARHEAGMYKPQAAQPAPFGDPLGKDYLYSVPIYNPTESHLKEAEAHRAHARRHEAAAQYLESFEQSECRKFPPATRAACPLLGPVARIDDIPGGVRVRFTEGVRVDAVIAHMRCHYAYAQTRGFDGSVGCPLYVRGLEIRPALDPLAVELVAKDEGTAREIRDRSREEAVFVRGGRGDGGKPPATP